MAQNVKINGVVYSDVPKINIPLSEGAGSAEFYDTTTATAEAKDILLGQVAFGDHGSVTGNMPNNGAVDIKLTKANEVYNVPLGYHDGGGRVQLSDEDKAALVEGNIKAGTTILGISGKASVVETEDATATEGTIVKGKTAYINGQKVTGSLTTVAVSQDSTTKMLTIE